MYTMLKKEVNEGLAIVTIDRPEALNALNNALLQELKDMFTELRDDEEVRAIILTGAGKDLEKVVRIDDSGLNPKAKEASFHVMCDVTNPLCGKDGATYTFCVESYLTGADTDVYKAVEALQAGDKVDIEGFVYWYDADEDASGDGINTHITKITVVG